MGQADKEDSDSALVYGTRSCALWQTRPHHEMTLSSGSHIEAYCYLMRLYTHPYLFQISSAHSAMSDSLIHHGLQHAMILCHHQSRSLLKLMCIKTVMPSNQLIHHHPLHFLPQSFPASESFPMNQFFASGGQSIGVSASASVLPMNIHDWFPLDWLVWFPCSPRDSQESSLTPQFRSIRSSVLSFLYSPTLLELTTGKTNKQTNKQTKKHMTLVDRILLPK